MRVRVRFTKSGVMRFVGHLDLMRYFQKAIRRAELPIRYSEGFSPHQILSFASPLSVGLTSDGEYMEMELTDDGYRMSDVVEKLGSQMADGITIVSAHILPQNAKNAMASLAAARYIVSYRGDDPFSDEDELREAINGFYGKGLKIVVTKKTKKGERTLDIAPLIYEFTCGTANSKIYYDMLVSAGSTENIRPELVIETFHKALGSDYDFSMLMIHRADMYEYEDNKLISMDMIYDNRD